MTNDLIARLRDMARGRNNPIGDLLTEAAAALEAAREDAAEAKQNGYELGLLAAAREDAERWNELCRQIDAGEFHPSILDDAMNMGAGALEMHVDAAIDAAREARNG